MRPVLFVHFSALVSGQDATDKMLPDKKPVMYERHRKFAGLVLTIEYRTSKPNPLRLLKAYLRSIRLGINEQFSRVYVPRCRFYSFHGDFPAIQLLARV